MSTLHLSRRIGFCLYVAGIIFYIPFSAHGIQLDAVPGPLVRPGKTPLLSLKAAGASVVANPDYLVVLGKALFWDMSFGEQGVTCATCHHHAGIDSRIENQLGWTNPESFGSTSLSGPPTKRGEKSSAHFHEDLFPFVDSEGRYNPNSGLNRVIGSQGVRPGRFDKERGLCVFFRAPRQVTRRNTPSIINAAFMPRLFWDGRAGPTFNGVNIWGERSHDNSLNPLLLSKHRLTLSSQALGPLGDHTEMACEGQQLADIGRRIIFERALKIQSIDPKDSVLGPFRLVSGKGLQMTYAELFKKSFSAQILGLHGDDPVNTEKNFSPVISNFGLLAGVALQAYEETLISDQSKFDGPRNRKGYPASFSAQEIRGLDTFNRLECDFCHQGPLFTASAVELLTEKGPPKWVDRRVISIDRVNHKANIALMDVGFANIGVTPTEEDIGLGISDPWGKVVSFSEQYAETLSDPGTRMTDPVQIDPSQLSIGFGVDFHASELTVPFSKAEVWSLPVPKSNIAKLEIGHKPGKRLFLSSRGSFKVPSLRNVELTGPYMHNGSMKNLEEVIDFYDRGGNFENEEKLTTFVHPQNLSDQEKKDLKAFLLTLTDSRVKWEKAPFDHPELNIPVSNSHGSGRPDQDVWINIPAVGAIGRPVTKGPLLPFEERLKKNKYFYRTSQ